MKSFPIGTIKGPWRIISKPEYREFKKYRRTQMLAWYRCECIHCGAVNEVSSHRLVALEKRGTVHCWECNHKSAAPITATQWHKFRETRFEQSQSVPTGIKCRRCFDYPWRRPENGTPCKCGLRYSREVIEAPLLIGSSACAIEMSE